MKQTKFRQIGISVLALVVLLVAATSIKSANASLPVGKGSPATGQALVRTSERSDQSPPLSDIPARVTRQMQPADNENPIIHGRYPGMPKSKTSGDGALQKLLSPNVMPTPIQNFDGQYNQYGPIPPDTNGDVGRNHYIQIVNSGFVVYSKTGTLLYGPSNNNTLFTGFGGICEATNSGDPVALYDSIADRWVLNWFTGQSNPTHQCIAVSTGPNPLGSWYRYDFITSPVTSAFEDYPHMGVWPDAYYMTTNEFNTANGGGNYAFDRAKMLRGDPTAAMVLFTSADGGLLPSDFDGSRLPPAGSPNYFFEWFDTSNLAEYKFHVDWAVPSASTFTGPVMIPVASFVYPAPGVPQPGTAVLLQTISDRIMYRVAYRNFGTYESIVFNHTVNASGVASPRWYELRDPNNVAGASVFQQGTFAPGDGVSRWMGSIAQDSNGDIAMGYSASSSTIFPSIRYAGRIPTDPVGTFGQGEATLFAGTGSEDYASPGNRWGDYSNISIDPFDDCTFWYTQEYFAQTALRAWRTRIGSFKLPQCTSGGTPTPVATPTGGVPTATNTPAPSPTLCPNAITATDSITNAEPTQTGRLSLFDPKSSCSVPKAVSAMSESLTRHYRSYNYTNTSGSPQCVTVAITQDCGNNVVQSIAYLGTFNPASITTNYLADGGAGGRSYSYSFTLPPAVTAVVVVVEVSPNLGCATYTLRINSNPCGSSAGTPTSTVVLPTITPPGPTVTNTPAPTNTPGGPPSPTQTPCPINFTDVHPTDYFYTPVQYLFCRGVISGYGTEFRPYNNTSRGQLCKIVVLGLNIAINTAGGPHFIDVLPTNVFYPYVETLFNRGSISGYGTEFRPNDNVSRGQLSKIVVLAAGWERRNPATATFDDVPVGSTFFNYVETAVCHGIVSGYGNLFKPNDPATRGQISKIVYLAITNTTVCP